MRDTRGPASDPCVQALETLRTLAPSQLVSLVLSTSSSRGRPSILDVLRTQAGVAHCRISLAETRGVAVRWVDGIVCGSVEDIVDFLTMSRPVLARCHGRTELTAA